MAFKLLEAVTATNAIPEAGVRIGMVGAIVEVYTGDDFEVEFCNDNGETLVMVVMHASQLAPYKA